ncbi:hypothetical protein AAVH_06200 [Aphelenchoides avenae]|nr:hypothetical protein AAVH_06200 [Aphelenchus avenae]
MVVKTAPAKGSTSTKVVTRPQTLSNEILLDVLKYVDRRSLDNMYLMRRFEPLLDHCDQLRTVSEAYFSYSSSTFTHSVVFAIKVKTKKRRSFEWMPPTIVKKTFYADVSVDTKSLKRAVDVFTKALLHSHITGEVRFENVELSRYFVTQIKSIANRYIIDGNSLVVRGISLKLDVSPMDFIIAFGILHELNRSAAEWYDFVGLDDRVLKHFATQGILKLSQCEVRRTSVDKATLVGLPSTQ